MSIVCSSCPANVSVGSFDEYIEHLYDEHDLEQMECPFCSMVNTFPSGGELAMHCLYMHAPATSGEEGGESQSGVEDECYACPLCDFVATTASLVEDHVNQNHYEEEGTSASSSLPSSLCPVCGRAYSDASLLAIHVNEHFEDNSAHFRGSHHPSTSQTNDDANVAKELDEQERKRMKLVEAAEFRVLQAQYGMDEKGSYSLQAKESLERDMQHGRITFDSYLTDKYQLALQERAGVEDVTYSVKSLITRISQTRPPDVVEMLMCSPTIEHCSTSRGDNGWGCGYRNVQMVLSSLRRESSYRDALGKEVFPNGHLPSIPQIQTLIERAWEAGFDPTGRQQLNGTLRDTRKWIGTTEASLVFLPRGVKVELIDFHRATGPDNTHPKLFDYVYNYFRSHQNNGTFCPPIYLQHEGHSRTIVGIERLRSSNNAGSNSSGTSSSTAAANVSAASVGSAVGGQSSSNSVKGDGKDVDRGSNESDPSTYRLLIFDPSHPRPRMLNLLTSEKHADFRVFRKRMADLRKGQFQLMVIKGIITSPNEMQHFKLNIPFTRIP